MVHMVGGILGFKDPNIVSLRFLGKTLIEGFRSGKEITGDSLELFERKTSGHHLAPTRTKEF